VFIIDPWLWAIFAAGLLAGWRWAGRRTRAAAISLVVATAYIGLSGALHEWAEAEVRERLTAEGPRKGMAEPNGLEIEGGESPGGFEATGATRSEPPAADAALGDVDVLPLPFYGPLRWHAVAWAGDELLYARVKGLPPVVRPTGRERHGLGDPRVHRALLTPAGQAFLWWARVPAARVLEERQATGGTASGGSRTVIGLADRRFWVRGDVFGLEVALDEEGRYLGAAWEGDSVFEPAPGEVKEVP
jgi:hypothetical protein